MHTHTVKFIVVSVYHSLTTIDTNCEHNLEHFRWNPWALQHSIMGRKKHNRLMPIQVSWLCYITEMLVQVCYIIWPCYSSCNICQAQYKYKHVSVIVVFVVVGKLKNFLFFSIFIIIIINSNKDIQPSIVLLGLPSYSRYVEQLQQHTCYSYVHS